MKNEEMALLFSEATPYIQKYHGKTLVIKYGGNAMVNEELKLAVMNDLVTLTLLGVRVVLVHGGGPAINQMLNRVGKESKFVNGLRYTDKETMSIVQQVLAGQVNKDLVALLKGRGVGLCGLDGHTITCSRKSDVDLGYVGNVEKVDTTLIEHLLNDGFIPVIATVGMDENGIAYNINADTAAAAIAIALHAEKFVSMTAPKDKKSRCKPVKSGPQRQLNDIKRIQIRSCTQSYQERIMRSLASPPACSKRCSRSDTSNFVFSSPRTS